MGNPPFMCICEINRISVSFYISLRLINNLQQQKNLFRLSISKKDSNTINFENLKLQKFKDEGVGYR